MHALAMALAAVALAAPGRTTLPVVQPELRAYPEAGGAGVALALPDGSAILGAAEYGEGFVAVRVRHDGSLDPSFGTAGIAHVPVALPIQLPDLRESFVPLELLRRADGRLLVVGGGARRSREEL